MIDCAVLFFVQAVCQGEWKLKTLRNLFSQRMDREGLILWVGVIAAFRISRGKYLLFRPNA